MCDAPTHTHIDVPKCSSYDGRHTYLTNDEFYGDMPGGQIEMELMCTHCGLMAKAHYKLIEVVEGE